MKNYSEFDENDQASAASDVDQYIYYNPDFYSEETIEDFKSQKCDDGFSDIGT